MTVLAQPTLVLNRSWVAVTTTTVRRALTLLYSDAAKVVSPETYETYDFHSWTEAGQSQAEDFVATVSVKIPVPEVILLTMYNGVPSMEVVFSRRNLFKRDLNQCQYCGCKPGTAELSIDHVIPRSRGGKSTWENCVLACTNCNRRKANRTPREARMALRCEPKQPRWAPHIDVSLGRRRRSWSRFISDRYWDVALEP
jgi:5-methylcytosine-specific restriction endonuclease McrA